MNYYLEVTLINDQEFGFSKLWSAVFTQLHLAFVEQKDAIELIPFGVSFPGYKFEENNGKSFACLGSKIRIFAKSEEELKKLDLDKWLARLTDYVHIKSIKPVEKVTQYLTVSRYRVKAIEKVANSFANLKKISFDEALQHCQTYKRSRKDYPYILIKSLSDGHDFSLCINQQFAQSERLGKFSTYGLSATSTVPHW